MVFSKHRNIINVIIMGFAFLFVFSAYQTSSMFVTIVLNSAGNNTGSGYISLAIINITFGFSNWITPFLVVWLTEKYSLFTGSMLYTMFFLLFLYPIWWTVYLGSFLVGIAAAVLWVSQGIFLSRNSTSSNVERNTIIFWILYQSSLVFGNIFQFIMFRNSNKITDVQRVIFYTVFAVICGTGAFLILLLRKPESIYLTINESLQDVNEERPQNPATFTPKEAFFRSFQLLKRKTFLALLLIFAYTGFEGNFYSGVFGTSIGQTKALGKESISYIGLVGVMIGLGELTSPLILIGLSRLWKGFSSDLIVVIGLFAHIVTFYVVYLSLPYESPQRPSNGATYITPRVDVLCACGYLLGFGDSVFNVQIMALLADSYKGIDCPAAFALYNFVQTVMTGIGFYYCTFLTLQWQLLIMVVFGVLGTIFYIAVQNEIRSKKQTV